MALNETLLAIAGGALGMGGIGGGVLLTVRHFRTKQSDDHKVDVEAEVKLDETAQAQMAAAVRDLAETVRVGVFDANARHSAEMAAERESCDQRLSRMGERVDAIQSKRIHDMKNMLHVQLGLAESMRLPPGQLATFQERSAALIRDMEADGNAIASAR